MGPVWSLAPPSGAARAAVSAAFLAAVLLFVFFQEIGLKLRREEQRAWWAGSGRDLMNALGLGAIAWTLHLSGFPLPAAVLVGGTLTLLLFGAYVFMATQTASDHPRVWAMLAGVVFALPVVIWPAGILAAVERAVRALFPLG